MEVVADRVLQGGDVDLVQRAAGVQPGRRCGGPAHGEAGAHDPQAGECRRLGVNAAPGDDDIVQPFGQHRAERDVVDVAFVEERPVGAGHVAMQFDRPGRAGDGVVRAAAGRDILHGDVAAPDDGPGLADAGVAVDRDLRFSERLREFAHE